ncbi:hypothetical protein CIPAW_15G109300 [Carya illinoinensis]|uniref:Uncharacterized protein n=1 Tax=Carya illinoinensis TaxID=32201 RepID=A0A8T1NEB9_CARIL|nr:hypothetical protein CIPAW_15G109300 [Carya illinoinensis]
MHCTDTTGRRSPSRGRRDNRSRRNVATTPTTNQPPITWVIAICTGGLHNTETPPIPTGRMAVEGAFLREEPRQSTLTKESIKHQEKGDRARTSTHPLTIAAMRGAPHGRNPNYSRCLC